ncbi:type II secretion system minor pseudopilin GspK [Escherichia coli]|nr:type II secretion system minor pseudopilin GspK [Escherichia coli]EKP2500049.1 type II secretion system minor pseudopilin GspK [Escherichia coli]EKP2839399.1 type II secretion system minor pseudopilin GspK [Escherichia coli]EKP2908869.1 type II secretion system minor pseudopilin GspK [Escherichia coli]EKP9763489.1 type II secretion system minor pseudopilin GspK [Escherichia coli]
MKVRERGVALLLVLLILALMVTIAAEITERNGRTYLRTVTQIDQLQAKWYGRAAEAMVRKILHRDKQDSQQKTHLAQNWAQTERQFQFEGGEVRGQIVDAQACFNLNSINQGGGDQNSAPYPARVFQQLLLNLQVKPVQAAHVTAALRDWIDTNNNTMTGGAEDEMYMALERPYLAANQPMQDVSELRMVSGVDASLYRKLLPYVCVLPTSTLLVNINTLRESQGALLAALFLKDQDIFPAIKLLQKRPRTGWDSVATFLALPQLTEIETSVVIPNLAVSSDYFMAHFYILIGSRQFSQHSLMIWKGKDIYSVQRKYGLTMMVVP